MRHLVWGLWVVAACSARDGEKSATPRVDHLTPEHLGEATRAMTDIGPRMVATPQEIEARDAVVALFEDAGLEDVHTQAFTWDAWKPGRASIAVAGQTHDAEALSPSPMTDLDTVLRGPDDDFRGAALLVSDGHGARSEQFLQASSGGATALIRVTDKLGRVGKVPLIEVGHTLEGASLPSLGVDHATGQLLREHRGEQARLHIAPNLVPNHTSHNVVGRVEGTEPLPPIYVVAHYDSWHPSESAFDNALGVGAMVLLARQLAQGPAPSRDVVFLATSAEEQGLQGAIAYVRDNPEASTAALVITLDVLWSGEGNFVVQSTDPHHRQRLLHLATSEGLDPRDGDEPGIGSDHTPFVGRGVPAVWCGRWSDRHYHTTEDRLEFIDLEQAAAATRVHWALLNELL